MTLVHILYSIIGRLISALQWSRARYRYLNAERMDDRWLSQRLRASHEHNQGEH